MAQTNFDLENSTSKSEIKVVPGEPLKSKNVFYFGVGGWGEVLLNVNLEQSLTIDACSNCEK